MKSYIEYEVLQDFDPNEDEEGEEYVLISKLYIIPEDRGQGKARALLQLTLKEIQELHPEKEIKLAASKSEPDTDLDRLVSFYAKEGFCVEDIPDCPFVLMKKRY
jgi:predicted GNAT family N-acyltransferase